MKVIIIVVSSREGLVRVSRLVGCSQLMVLLRLVGILICCMFSVSQRLVRVVRFMLSSVLGRKCRCCGCSLFQFYIIVMVFSLSSVVLRLLFMFSELSVVNVVWGNVSRLLRLDVLGVRLSIMCNCERMMRMLMLVSILYIIVGEVIWNQQFRCSCLVSSWMVLVSSRIGLSMVILQVCISLKISIVRLVVGLLICSGELVRKLIIRLLMMLVSRFLVGGILEVMVMFMYSGRVMRNIIMEVIRFCGNVFWRDGNIFEICMVQFFCEFFL